MRWTVVRMILVTGFALAMVWAGSDAGLRFFLPNNPVPVTLQSLIAILAGVSLGARLGMLSMLLYLLGGMSHSYAFAGCDALLRGPTFGYLLGFLLAQPLVALASRIPALPPREYVVRLFLAAFVGHLVIFACGVFGLMTVLNLDIGRAFEMGVIPFVQGTVLKIAAAMLLGAPLLMTVRRNVEI